LLEAALAAAVAAGACAVDLEIEIGHERAASLYQRFGFAALERRRWTLLLAPPAPPAPAVAQVRLGGCFCGALRYRVAAVPAIVVHCHCSMCRRVAGAPFVTWATVARHAFAVTAGTPAVLRASPRAERTFCAACGTPLTFVDLAQPESIDVTVGSLDEPASLPPGQHIWTDSQLPWLRLDDDLPRHPRGTP
ncbi:MAG: GFA family protein, partial [Candidatus Binatia bacterium]